MSKMTPKQRLFVDEYLIDLNATQAAIRAGYSERTAYSQGQRLLKNVEVQDAIQKAVQERSQRTEIDQDRIIKEYALIGLADIRDYVRFDENGAAYIDFTNMPEEASRAIAEISQEEFMDGHGEDAREVRRTKFKLHSKLGALDSLARHLGMFVTRHEHSGPGGKPIEQKVHTTNEIVITKDALAGALAAISETGFVEGDLYTPAEVHTNGAKRNGANPDSNGPAPAVE